MENHIRFAFFIKKSKEKDFPLSRLSPHGEQQLYAYTPMSGHVKVTQSAVTPQGYIQVVSFPNMNSVTFRITTVSIEIPITH